MVVCVILQYMIDMTEFSWHILGQLLWNIGLYGKFAYTVTVFRILYHLRCENLNLCKWIFLPIEIPTSWYFLTIMIHQKNVYQFGSYTYTSQTLQLTFPVPLTTSSCSQALLELCKVLSGTARAFYGVSECTYHYDGAFWMVWDMTEITVKC